MSIISHELTFTQCWHTHQHTRPSLHSQSQIRWQISRLILLGRAWYWGSPLFSELYPKTDTHTPHTHFIVWLRLCTPSSHRCPKTPPPRQVPAFSFSPLHLPFLPLPLPASLLLLLAASQPIRWEVTSSCCSQCGGRLVRVCAWWEKGRHTHTDTPGIIKGLLCVPSRPTNLNSLLLTTHRLPHPPPARRHAATTF